MTNLKARKSLKTVVIEHSSSRKILWSRLCCRDCNRKGCDAGLMLGSRQPVHLDSAIKLL